MLKKKISAFAPRCPFCDSLIEKPQAFEPKRLGDFEAGRCDGCGACYVHDITGHNLGSAWVECLGVASGDDWELAWSLLPGEDFVDGLINDYDYDTHLVHPTGRNQDGKRVRGVLTFIRFAEDLQEAIKQKGSNVTFLNRPGKGQPVVRLRSVASEDTGEGLASDDMADNKVFSKKEIEIHVKNANFKAIERSAQADRQIFRKLQRLLYSADEELRLRACVAIGKSARVVMKSRPAVVGELVRSLLSSSSDSAQFTLGTLESVGEIIRQVPNPYGSFVRHLLGYIAEPTRQASVLWAIGRIGEKHPHLVKSQSFFAIFDLLESLDPSVRGHAVWALGNLRASEAFSRLSRLSDDPGVFSLFDGLHLQDIAISDVAKQAVQKCEGKESSIEGKETEGQNMNNQKSEISSEEERQFQEAMKLCQEADIISNQGRSIDSMDMYQKAIYIFETFKYDNQVANTCEKLADLHVQRGNFKAALPLYQRGLAICEKKQDAISMVLLIEKLVDVYRANGEMEKTLPYYMKALEISESAGDAGKAAYFLTAIGDIFQRQGRLEDALDSYRLAHRIFKGMGSGERAAMLEKGIAELDARLAMQSVQACQS